ncbi:MAG: hypothetical protein HOV80_05355 [Polyangiaceae bacterium]|nr:hypothetical protein [Polyangiaceae bacterium]
MIRSSAILCFAAVVTGCASAPEPRIVDADDIGKLGSLEPNQALVIVFEPGDHIPLELSVGGPLVATPAGAEPIKLEVKRKFFLRIDGDGIKTSLDGKTFGKVDRPGSFSIGIGANQKGTRAHISITTPTPTEP